MSESYRWIKWPRLLPDGVYWINLDTEVSEEVDRNFWWDFAQRTKCLECYYGDKPYE